MLDTGNVACHGFGGAGDRKGWRDTAGELWSHHPPLLRERGAGGWRFRRLRMRQRHVPIKAEAHVPHRFIAMTMISIGKGDTNADAADTHHPAPR